MSDDALREVRTRCLYGTVAAVLLAIAALVAGFRGEVSATLMLVALFGAFAWWWFDHCLDVRQLAATFRERGPRAGG